MTFEPGTKVYYIGGDVDNYAPAGAVGYVIAEDFFGPADEGYTIVEFLEGEVIPGVKVPQVMDTNYIFETE